MRKEASRTFRSRRVVFALSAALVGSISPLSRASVPAAEARRELDAMGRAASELRDYTMTLVSQEWDGHRLGVPQTLLAKFARPFSVYYKRLCEPHKGRQVLFAEGWNGGKLKVSFRAWPINIRMNLDPHGALAMGGTRHPVDQTSIVYLVDVILENFRKADARGEAQAEDEGTATIDGRLCDRVRVIAPWAPVSYRIAEGESLWDVAAKFDLPMAPLLHANRSLGWDTPSDAKPGQTISVPRYYAGRVELWIDRELNLPIVAEIYDGDGVMFERFEHKDLKINVGLGPMDFSPQNPEYKF